MKLKVVFILKNGHKFIVKCKSFKMTKLSGSQCERELFIEDADRYWSIDVDEVVAVYAKKVLF